MANRWPDASGRFDGLYPLNTPMLEHLNHYTLPTSALAEVLPCHFSMSMGNREAAKIIGRILEAQSSNEKKHIPSRIGP